MPLAQKDGGVTFDGWMVGLLSVSSFMLGYLVSELADHVGYLQTSARLAKELSALRDSRGEKL